MDIYKSFGFEDSKLGSSNFSLMPITDAYSSLNDGKEVYFLNALNEPVRVLNISKEPYSGKIYDVDVENDVVLVRRKNSSAIWSGNSNNGTAYGNASQTDAGYLGKGFEFDGNGDYVQITNSESINITTGNITLSVWAKSNASLAGGIQLFGNWIGASSMNYGIFWYDSCCSPIGLKFFAGQNAAGLSTNPYNDGNWHHIVGMANSSGVYLYVDSIQKASASKGALANTNRNWRIGVGDTSWAYFNGTIDEVMIFNRSLSAEEIRGLYANQSSRYLTNNFTSLADGTHTFKAYAQDLGGNVNSTELRTVTVDTTQPSFSNNQTNATLTTPKINDVLQLNITVSDNIDIDSITLAHNQSGTLTNATTLNYTGSSDTSITSIFNLTITMTRGLMQWQIWANDSTGNSNVSQQFTVVIQNTAPITPNLTSPANNSNFNQSSITFNFSSSDADSDTITYYFFINSVYNDSTTNNNITKVFSDGSYNWSVIAGDGTDNSSISSAYHFLVDTIYPNISFVSPPTPANGTSQADTYIYANVSASDSASNISTFIDFDDSLVSWWRFDEGNGTIDYMNRNNGTINGNAHQITAGYLGKGFSFDGNGDYVQLALPSSLGWDIPFSVSFFGKATTNQTFRAPINIISGTKLQLATIYYTNTNKGIAISHRNYTVNNIYWTTIPANALNDQSTWHHFVYTHSGGDGHGTLYIDGQLNNATLNQHFTEFGNNVIQIGKGVSSTYDFNGTIDDVMIFNRSLSATEIQALYANTSSKYLGVNFTSLSEGAHSFKAYTQDYGGNVNSTELRTVTVDTTQPSFSNNQTNASSTTYNGTDVQINLTISNTAIDYYTLTHNDTSDGTWANESFTDAGDSASLTMVWNYSITNFPTTGGTMGWQVWANDTAGNVNVSNIYTFSIIETIPPSFSSNQTNVTATTPRYNEVVQINITLTDNNAGLDGYFFAHNDTSTMTNGSYRDISGSSHVVIENITIDTLTRDDVLGWQVWANDSAGNVNVSGIYSLVIRNTAPSIPSVTSPTDGEISNSINIEFNSTDIDGDAISYTIYTNNTLNITTAANITAWNASDGYYNLTITADDSADYSSNSSVIHFTLDTTAPTVSIIYPTNALNISSNSIELNGSGGDNINKSSLTYYWVINGTTNSTSVDSNSTFNASDGYYNLTLFVSDGVQNGSDAVYFRLDTTAPSWSGNETNASLMKINGNATFNITVLDYGSGLSFYIFSWNGTGTWLNDTNGTISGTSVKLVINKSTNLSQGNTVGYRWYANDSANNWNNSLLRVFTVVNTAPSINTTIPDRTVNQSTYWEFDANASDGDVGYGSDTLTWYINNSIIDIDSSTGNISDTPLENESGNYTINITVSDGTFNDSQTFYYAILDNAKPTINTVTVSPTIGEAGNEFNITANVTDGKEVDTVIAYVQKPDENNTATITLNLNNGLYNGTWNSSGKADGTYVIDIISNDTSGNEKERENGAVIALSTNAQNVSVNSSVNLVANVSIVVNVTAETDTWLNITSNTNTTASISISKYSENIQAISPTGVTGLGKYIDIIVDNNTNNNISFAEVRVYYTDTEVSSKNLQESTLRLYKYNESSALWNSLSGGVDTILNYVWGNVTSFSSFGIFGTQISAGAPGGGGGGGAGGAIGGGSIEIELPKKEIEKKIELSQDSFEVDMVIGGSKIEELIITNTGDIKLAVNVDVKAVKEYLFLSDTGFELGADESKTITLNFIAKDIGTQTGKIIIEADGIKELIPIMVNIESEKVLFDVKMDIPAKYRRIKQGEGLLAQITLLSIGEPKKVDIFITYLIKDLNNKIISKGYETIAVEKEISFVKSFPTNDLEPGEYIVVVEVDYDDSIAISGGMFKVEKYAEMPAPVERYRLLGISLIVGSILMLIIMIVLTKRRKRFK